MTGLIFKNALSRPSIYKPARSIFMLHKGKLQAALNLKRGQFSLYDGTFSEQLKAYQQALETLYLRYPTSARLEHILPPDGIGGKRTAGARPSIEFDRWLVSAAQSRYHGPIIPF